MMCIASQSGGECHGIDTTRLFEWVNANAGTIFVLLGILTILVTIFAAAQWIIRLWLILKAISKHPRVESPLITEDDLGDFFSAVNSWIPTMLPLMIAGKSVDENGLKWRFVYSPYWMVKHPDNMLLRDDSNDDDEPDFGMGIFVANAMLKMIGSAIAEKFKKDGV